MQVKLDQTARAIHCSADGRRVFLLTAESVECLRVQAGAARHEFSLAVSFCSQMAATAAADLLVCQSGQHLQVFDAVERRLLFTHDAFQARVCGVRPVFSDVSPLREGEFFAYAQDGCVALVDFVRNRRLRSL